MIPWIRLGTAPVPGGGELLLMRRGDEFCIMSGAIPLMNSRYKGSEEALAELGAAHVASRAAPQVLIGGLGMGFTLRAALPLLAPNARVTVAELVPGVIGWARDQMATLFGDCLADPRVSIREADVGRVMREGKAAYDAILLDVDNGPEGLTRNSNDALYGLGGLTTARAALKPGGAYAVWSSHPSPAFTTRLKHAGFQTVNEVKARANGKHGGARHLIWLAVNGVAQARKR